MLETLAPILLFVYNRLEHTKKTINALIRNDLASESELIIYSDGPKNEEDQILVNAVRDFLKTITGFNKIEIHESTTNKGLSNSIIIGVTEIVNIYGKVIVLEDDILTSKYFLYYMNTALRLYEYDEEVVSIHGYVYPIKNLPQTFFLKGADCWGWATWKDSWMIFEPSGEKLLNELRSRNLEYEIDFHGSFPFTRMLIDFINKKNSSWAIRWYISAFLKNKLTLYPGNSMVLNIGNDSSGTHSVSSDIFDTQLTEKKVQFDKIDLIENQKVKKLFSQFFRINFSGNFFYRILRKFKNLKKI